MIRVQTGSRLHLGFFSLPGNEEEHVPGLSSRYWGGVGLMIENPGLDISAEPNPNWFAEGPLGERVLQFARQFLEKTASQFPQIRNQCWKFSIRRCAPQHYGLGTGTQLGLAVARLLTEGCQLPTSSSSNLARLVERGIRSAIGIHGFDQGGFLVEAGKRNEQDIAPLVARMAFPTEWRIILLMPKKKPGLHGLSEKQALEQIPSLPSDRLCRLVWQAMLPALVEKDIQIFGEAVYEYNRLVGEAFRPVQGGIYSHPESQDVITFLRREGIPGVGQSSWGPTLLAFVSGEDQAQHLASRIAEHFHFDTGEVVVTRGRNTGARVTA